MGKKYSLLSAEEPTDEQLHAIMADALIEVKRLNQISKQKSQELINKEKLRINSLKSKSIFYKNVAN
jgi:hypothetical protein